MSETREGLILRLRLRKAQPFSPEELEETTKAFIDRLILGESASGRDIRLLAEAARAQELRDENRRLKEHLAEYEQRDRLANIERYLVDDIEYLIRRARDADNAERRLEEVRSAAMEGDV